eukprot:3858113-Prymnesium_polylepis.1
MGRSASTESWQSTPRQTSPLPIACPPSVESGPGTSRTNAVSVPSPTSGSTPTSSTKRNERSRSLRAFSACNLSAAIDAGGEESVARRRAQTSP